MWSINSCSLPTLTLYRRPRVACCRFIVGKYGACRGVSRNRHFRVSCDQTTKEKLLGKFSPSLESEEQLSTKEAFACNEWKTIPDIWRTSAEKFGDLTAVSDPYHDPPTSFTYKQLEQEILDFCEGLRVIGLEPDEKIALFADNSCRWLVSDQAFFRYRAPVLGPDRMLNAPWIMASGAINVVRGTRSSSQELLQIYNHSESVALVLDDPELYNRISEAFLLQAKIRFIVFLWGEKSGAINEAVDTPVYSYKDVIGFGVASRAGLYHAEAARKEYTYKTISPDDIATIVYTSGTSGNPKGVMLAHRNLLHQVMTLWDVVPAVPTDRFLSMLPPWHAYERAAEYFSFTRGVEHVYTSVKNLKDDLNRYKPQYILSVPLVFEMLYRGIMKQIHKSSVIRKLVALWFLKISFAYMDAKRVYEGKCLTKDPKEPSLLSAGVEWVWATVVATVLRPFHALADKLVYGKIRSAVGISKAAVSGGGSLPPYIDTFFEGIGVTIQNGYGLTESSPVVAARLWNHNVLGSIGRPIRYTEIKVVDVETGETLPDGSRGIVKVRGPQVMKGYFKNPLATNQAIDEEGWLNTGDLGWICPSHSRGRSRDAGGVIVLEGRAKDTIVLSTGENVEPSVIEEAAMRSSLIQQIVVIGQDQRRLGAIIVPNREEVSLEAKKLMSSSSSIQETEAVKKILREELRKWTWDCSFQVNGPVLVVEEAFTVDNGLMTPTMKVKRDQVSSLYRHQIEELYK